MRQFFYTLIEAATSSGTDVVTSGKIDARQLYAISANIISSSGSNAGVLKLQGSNAPTGMGNVAMDFTPAEASWVDIPNATATVASGATKTVPVSQLCYAWVRAVWTASSGAGTITVQVNGQGF